MISNKKTLGILFFILSYTSLIISFFFNEDGSGGGSKGDFEVTYGFIIALQNNLLADPVNWTLVHTPLHFLILSFVTRLIEDPYLLRFLFCIFSAVLPIIFYFIIDGLHNNKKYQENLIILTCCIFFIPSFRYTSIWANNLITSLVFFSISIFFYKKWESSKTNHLSKNVLYQIIFLILATYTRQYFAVFFIYFLSHYYKELKFKSFLKLFSLCVLSSIPVFLYVYKFPELLTGQKISIYAMNNFILGNTSMMSLTLYPIILINIIYKNIKYRNFLISSMASFLIVTFLSLNLNIESWLGGGANFMLSRNIFDNNLYFYFTSFFTIATALYLVIENKENLILVLTLIFMFFSYQVYQRYYDPMFFLIFFTLIKSNLSNIFFINKKAVILLFLYFVFYYLVSLSNIIYKI